MTKTLNISHSYNRRRHTATEILLCCQADRLEKWIKWEQRMDSTSMTVTSSSVLILTVPGIPEDLTASH